MSGSPATEALVREIDSARFQDRPLVWLRISADAIPGSPTVVPLTPERARQVPPRAYRGPSGEVVVDGDPEVWMRSLELVVHPGDWLEALAELSDRHLASAIRRHQGARSGASVEFYGIPVRT